MLNKKPLIHINSHLLSSAGSRIIKSLSLLLCVWFSWFVVLMTEPFKVNYSLSQLITKWQLTFFNFEVDCLSSGNVLASAVKE